MSGLDSLTDQEFLAAEKFNKTKSLDKLSDEEFLALESANKKLAAPENNNNNEQTPFGYLGKKGLEGAVAVGEFLDKYTGAPTRAALGNIQDNGLSASPLSAFAKQFGLDPTQAPTGKEMAVKAGFSQVPLSERIPQLFSQTGEGLPLQKGGFFDVSPAGATGLGVDIVGDVSNLVPLGTVAKGLVKGGKLAGEGLLKGAAKGTELAAKGAGLGVDLVTGTKLGTGAVDQLGRVISTGKNVGSGVADVLSKTINPKVAEDFSKYSEIAAKNGIDPSLLNDSIEFGPSSVISRAARVQAEGPLGQPLLEKQGKLRESINNALERQVEQIGQAPPLDAANAGNKLRESFDEGLKNAFDKVDFTHAAIINQVPGLEVSKKSLQAIDSKLDGIEKFAKGRVLRGITNTQREQGKQLLNAVSQARNSTGSYKQMHEALKDIGEVAFNSRVPVSDIPADIEKLRDLYFTINDGLIDTAKSRLGPDIAQRLVDNNKYITSLLRDKDAVFHIISNNRLADENVFNRLIVNGDTKQLNSLKNIISPEAFNQLRGSYLDNFIKSKANGGMDMAQIKSLLEKAPARLGVLFSKDELKNISELIDLADRSGIAVMSTSGTGASQGFRGLVSGLGNQFIDSFSLDSLRERARSASSPLMSSVKNQKYFHGTDADIVGKFRPSASGPVGSGVYITPDENLARNFGEKIIPVDAKIKNPLKLLNQAEKQEDLLRDIARKLGAEQYLKLKYTDSYHALVSALRQKLMKEQPELTEVVIGNNMSDYLNKQLQKIGYDAIDYDLGGQSARVVLDPKNVGHPGFSTTSPLQQALQNLGPGARSRPENLGKALQVLSVQEQNNNRRQ